MIAKRVPMPEGGGRGFTGLQDYIEQAHKAVHTFSEGVTSLEDAAEEMHAVAEMNSRCKEPLYHLILSWPEFEKPTPEQVEEAVRAQIKALGFEGHQYIAAVHNDTPDMHVHVAINRVNPETFRAHHPRADFYTLDRTCREIELAQGWTHDRGPHVVEYVNEEAFIIEAKDRQLLRSLSEGGKKIERFTGEVSLERYMRDNQALKDKLDKAKSWQEVHDTLRVVGLSLNQVKDGFVITEDGTATHAKGSYALSKAAFTERLGTFTDDARIKGQEAATILKDLTQDRAVFTEYDLDAALKERVAPDSRAEIKQLVMSQAVHLEAEILPGNRTLARFTTKEVLAEEAAALNAAQGLKDAGATRINPEAMAQAIASRTMRPDQLDAFQRGMEAQGIGVVQGRAGTGKSYMMTAWMEAHRDSGYRVVGLAPTNIVAQAMVADGFEEGRTVDSVLHAAQKGKLDWDAQTVLILDEAGMVSNGRMKELLEIASARGAKVLMVGDDRQLPAVERGGLFAELGKRYGAGELTVITRQKEARQRDAAMHFSNGAFEKGMKIYADTGRLQIKGTDAEAREALLERWKADHAAAPKGEQFIATYANADVAWFNDEITRHLIDQGGITQAKAVKTDRGEQVFGVGSDVLFTATDKRLGVANGSRGKVIGWGRGKMHVRLSTGASVSVPLKGRKPFTGFAPGYAGTTYKSQGATIDRVYVHHTKSNKDAAAYVALTRQRNEAVIFSARETAADWREMARQMARTMTKTAASSIPRAATPHQTQAIQEATPELKKALPQDKAKLKAEIQQEPDAPEGKEQANRQDWEPARSKADLFAEYEAEKASHSAKTAVQMAAHRAARDKALAEVDAALKEDRRKAVTSKTPTARKEAVAHANHAAKVKRQAIRSASRRDGEALQAENPFPANFEDWLRRQDRPDAQEVLRQIIDRRERAKAVKRDHLIDPRQVMETLGAKFGWDLRATAGAARIYGDGAKLKMQKQIAVITDAAGQGLRWLDMVGQKTGSIRRLVSTIMGREMDDAEVKAETNRLYTQATAQNLGARATLHAADRRRLDATDLRQGWEQGVPLSAVPKEKDGLRIGPITVGELRTMPGAESFRLANISTTGDTAAAVIVPTQDERGSIKGFSMATGLGHFTAQGQAPMLTVLGDVTQAERVMVAYDFHTAASQWKDVPADKKGKVSVVLVTGSKRTLRELKATLASAKKGAEIQVIEPKAKALAKAMDGAKAVAAAAQKQALQQRPAVKPTQGLGL
jgi:hypothetical protein